MLKKTIRRVLFCCFLCSSVFCKDSSAQVIARLTVPPAPQYTAVPVHIDLDELTSEADSLVELVEVIDGKRVHTPVQIEHAYSRTLWWLLSKETGRNGKERVFELRRASSPSPAGKPVKVTQKNGALVIASGNKDVLQYNYKIWYPPAGVDTVFKRSGFIHPLWSPSGQELTRVNPPDHHHHFGIWNPWTKVKFKGKTVDFWNLGEKQGTVRFARFISREEGEVYGGFSALQEHVAMDSASGSEEVAMDETWNVRVYNIGEKMWLWDFTSILNCATDEPVILEEYRYGGFGFRATEEWTNKNSRILTSEGKTRKEADAANARWCIVEGDIAGGRSGIVFMGYPTNYNFPEPTRVWPEDMYNRGDVFFSFSPTRDMDWPLEPGKNYVLKYRMLVYDGTITAAQAEEAWKNFAHPPKISVRKQAP